MLLSNSENREHPKNFKNVDCVVTNHNKVQDTRANQKPQTYYRCCSQLSFLTPYWLFPRNIIAFLKYFWCSQFCEFHIKILFDKNHSFKYRGKASQVCAASLSFEILFPKWNEIIIFFVCNSSLFQHVNF